MNVRELIDLLQTFDPEAKVVLYDLQDDGARQEVESACRDEHYEDGAILLRTR